MSGLYWGLTALHLMGRADALDADEVAAWVLSCGREVALTKPTTAAAAASSGGGGGGDEPQQQQQAAEAPAAATGWAFGGSPRNDAHLLYTTSALQILALLDRLGDIDADAVAAYVASLQQPDGSFAGDAWGEVDTRFTYCALLSTALLGKTARLDVRGAVAFVAACKNFDGGFGCVPGLFVCLRASVVV
jgi:geranylgeranyl transferase type-2 subunit beta